MSYEQLQNPGPLFRPFVLARRADPPESKLAAKEASRDGAVTASRNRALKAVQAHPGRTATELEHIMDTEGRIIGRRLGELEKLGVVTRKHKDRRCLWSGRICSTWYPV